MKKGGGGIPVLISYVTRFIVKNCHDDARGIAVGSFLYIRLVERGEVSLEKRLAMWDIIKIYPGNSKVILAEPAQTTPGMSAFFIRHVKRGQLEFYTY